MHLTMVTGAFPVRSQLFLVNKARSLAQRGHRVTVLATEPGDGDLEAELPAATRSRITVVYQRRHRGLRGRLETLASALPAVVRDPRAAARLARLIWRRQPSGRRRWARLARSLPLVGLHADVVHVEWSTKAAERSEALSLVRVPRVVSCRGSDVRVLPLGQPGLEAELRWLLPQVDAVHCVSRAVADDAMALGAPADRIFVNHPGVDPALYAPPRGQSRRVGPVRLLSVGRSHWVKGHTYAVRAVRLLLDRGCDVRLTIVGGASGDDSAALQATIRHLDLEGTVVLTSSETSAPVRRRLAEADLFLSSSLSEGMSNAAIEAMAAGLPVVVTAVGGMPELIRTGAEGLVVPPRDPPALADAVERLVREPELRHRLGAGGRERVLRDFTLERQAEAFTDHYERLVATMP